MVTVADATVIDDEPGGHRVVLAPVTITVNNVSPDPVVTIIDPPDGYAAVFQSTAFSGSCLAVQCRHRNGRVLRGRDLWASTRRRMRVESTRCCSISSSLRDTHLSKWSRPTKTDSSDAEAHVSVTRRRTSGWLSPTGAAAGYAVGEDGLDVGDVDGDNIVDVVVGARDLGAHGTITAGLLAPDATKPLGQGRRVRLVDFDGDGAMDVLSFRRRSLCAEPRRADGSQIGTW